MLAYFDCFAGISGDMTLGALVDLGVPVDWLQNELSRLPLTGYQMSTRPVMRSGIQATGVRVEIQNAGNSRNYKKIKLLLEDCVLSDGVKSTSLAVFERLARAEADIHGCAIEEVHFHEVGGVDAIVDIVGSALCLEKLGITEVMASPLPVGSGFVDCQHGRLPLPAPATIEILKDVPLYGTDVVAELVTPTGAAIIACLAESFGPLPPVHIKKIGYGAGQRELTDRPNLLRILLGTAADTTDNLQTEHISILETCIDDMNPEFFGFLLERLYADGALDVYWIPVHMKKNRPGTLVQVLCREDRKDALIQRLLSETTSLGVRYYQAARRMLAREQVTVHTSFGEVRMKRVTDPGGGRRLVPEYDVCREIALRRNIPLRSVYETIAKEAAEINISDKR
ncbi:MAG: nickel pincer cofactor biosynthesis protein LarC [Deltaproteobacteria bacterium]|jgi:uncharacterized protein (TIGR00299 family) protein|nr:nickel pincer cofactor biosynthesis protein LarC [Deltaproteobacteria bacterium]